MTFTDGSTQPVDVIICATGYDLDLPYLSSTVPDLLGPGPSLYQRTFHPGAAGLRRHRPVRRRRARTWPLLELQARWVVAVWSGEVALPEAARATPLPPLDAHNALALTLSEELGVAPDPADWPELSEPLLFGPMLPPRYRLVRAGCAARGASAVRGAARRLPARAGRSGGRRGAGTAHGRHRPALSLRQPPARLLAMICRNIAPRAASLTASPS